jgi:hypothetical protein
MRKMDAAQPLASLRLARFARLCSLCLIRQSVLNKPNCIIHCVALGFYLGLRAWMYFVYARPFPFVVLSTAGFVDGRLGRFAVGSSFCSLDVLTCVQFSMEPPDPRA